MNFTMNIPGLKDVIITKICGKRFAEKNSFVERYQRFSKEWNQAVKVRSIKAISSQK